LRGCRDFPARGPAAIRWSMGFQGESEFSLWSSSKARKPWSWSRTRKSGRRSRRRTPGPTGSKGGGPPSSGFQRARRLFGRGAATKRCARLGRVRYPHRPTPGGCNGGRLQRPLAKMARGPRAHLVSGRNDLFTPVCAFNIKEALSKLNAAQYRLEVLHISGLRALGQILVTVFRKARNVRGALPFRTPKDRFWR